jgi:hypothetical protein
MAFNDPRNAGSLFTRDFYFKDAGNRPIAANKALISRGDGGTYWSDASTPQVAFNFLRASTIEYAASNSSNVIWFEPGAGIEFYSTVAFDGTPIVWIAGKGPETLQVVGQPSIDLLNLPDNIVGGNTLTFQGSGDIQIYVSGATLTFDANNASTFSSITGLQEDTAELFSTSQVLANELEGLTNTVNTLLISSAVSTFWSTLVYTKNLAENLSTFVYSTFVISGDTLNITYPNVYISSLTVDDYNGPIISTFSSLYWSSGFGVTTQTSNLYLSTITGDTSPLINFDNANNRIGVNLGQTPPRATVDVGGIVFANAFVTASDSRLKTAVEPLYAGDLPSAYRFTWIRDGSADVGCMADEVEAVAPECVTVGGDGYKAVNYSKLVPYCLATIKELSARVAALESRGQ